MLQVYWRNDLMGEGKPCHNAFYSPGMQNRMVLQVKVTTSSAFADTFGFWRWRELTSDLKLLPCIESQFYYGVW